MEEMTPAVQVLETADYSEILESIHEELLALEEVGGFIEGFLLFFCVVVLCYFSYKFLRIFF